MTNDLFFTQPVPNNPSTGIQHDMSGVSGVDPSFKIQAPRESFEGDGEKFLAMLKRVFQVRTSTKQAQVVDETQPSISAGSIRDDQIDETFDSVTSHVDMPTQNKEHTEPDQLASDRKFAEFVKMLEGVGFYDAIRESDHKNQAPGNPTDGRRLTAMNTLIDRLQQTQLNSSTNLKAGLEYLSQFNGPSLEENILRLLNRNSGHRFSLNQVTDLADFQHWLKGFSAGLQDQIERSDLFPGQDVSVTRPAVTTPIEMGLGVERPGQSFGTNSIISGTGSLQSTQNSAVLPQSKNRSDMVWSKLVSDPPTLASKIHQNTQATNPAGQANVDFSQNKAASVFLPDSKITNRLEVPNRIVSAPNQDQLGSTDNIRISQPPQPMTSSGMNLPVANVPERKIQSTTGEEPLSRVFQDTQLVKKGVVQVESAIHADAGNKVIKTDAGNNENGLMNSAGQITEKSADNAVSLKDTVPGPSNLRASTVDQIVRRAVLQLQNGPHEARIDLKPEFLGHIRMLVISENQQVTVKILAEYGFVKDMIENSSHQLKTDLQQHGLEFDKLEVSVSRDSDDYGRPRDYNAGSKTKSDALDRNTSQQPAEDKSKDQRRAVQSAHKAVTIDFFA